MASSERCVYNCEPVDVLPFDPVPSSKKAVADARRRHPNADILPEVISSAIDLLERLPVEAPTTMINNVNALIVGSARRIAEQKY
jgi:hypothetical protein